MTKLPYNDWLSPWAQWESLLRGSSLSKLGPLHGLLLWLGLLLNLLNLCLLALLLGGLGDLGDLAPVATQVDALRIRPLVCLPR